MTYIRRDKYITPVESDTKKKAVNWTKIHWFRECCICGEGEE